MNLIELERDLFQTDIYKILLTILYYLMLPLRTNTFFPLPVSTYNKIWAEAQESLNCLLQKEIEEKSQKPLKDHLLIFQMLATFYIKYVQIFHNLESAYDQIVHPQKRLIIRQVLDGVMGRILELKNEMVELEYSEYHYFDDILQDLKLSPVSILQKCIFSCPASSPKIVQLFILVF